MTNATGYQKNGYLAAARSTGSPQAVEYHVFSRVTGALNSAQRDDANFADMAQAVHDNLMLWDEIALAVASDDNALPVDLRARLFYLAEFTHAHSRKVLRHEVSADALIEINTMVMGGLRTAKAAKEAERCPA